MRSVVSTGVSSVSHIGVISDTVKIKSPDYLEAKVSSSRVQKSMRRSKFSGELDRDMALPAPQPSARLPATTPLNPVTPLRWKSSKRLELEKKKLQEELKAKEAVKEEKKKSTPPKEEKKDRFSKTAALSKPEVTHKGDKDTRFATSASTSEPTVYTQSSGKFEDLKHSSSVTNGGGDDQATHREETAALNGVGGSNGDSGIDKKAHTVDESSVVTIDFLRARLLAERASSKAAKERVQQLSKKVLELEGRLDQEIQSRKKAEEAAHDALSKFEVLGKQVNKEGSRVTESSKSVPETSQEPNLASGSLLPHEKTKNEQEDHDSSDRAAEVDEASPNATVVAQPDHTLPESIDSRDRNEEILIPSPDQAVGDRHGIRGSEKLELQEDRNRTVPTVISTTQDSGLERQKRRFAVEERLRHMWDQMTEEMAALAGDKTQEELVREQLLNWMGQVPSVLQDVLPKPSEEEKLVSEPSSKNFQLKEGEVQPALSNLDQVRKSGAVEDLSLNKAPPGSKTVASLIERFEAQENGQREMEQSFTKQNSTGRRRSNEGSMSRTSSNSGTLQSAEFQQESQPEQLVDSAPNIMPQTEHPGSNNHSTNSLVSPRQEKSTDSFHTRKDDRQTPEIRTPSTSADAGEVVERSGEEGITHKGTERTEDRILEGADGALITTSITPPLNSASFGPGPGENRGRSLEDQLALKASNHHLSPRALEGTYEALVNHPGGSQLLAGWANLEDAQTYTVATNRESAWQRDASFVGQQQKLGSYSQAGNSNAYMRPEVPGTYPLRNDEREIYRGRMESVSRSMEGIGESWTSLFDPEGEELHADMPESNESGIIKKPSLQMPFQVNGGSGRSNNYQAESAVGTSQNFAFPGREFKRDNFHCRSSPKLENTTSKVDEVLKALQLAKLSIQKTGAGRTSISNTCYSTSQHSYSGAEKHNLKMDYGYYGGDGMTNRSPVAIRVWSHQELSRRYSTGNFGEPGSPPRLQYSNSSAPFEDSEEDHPLAGRSSPVSTARRQFVDEISSGGGVQYFYPN